MAAPAELTAFVARHDQIVMSHSAFERRMGSRERLTGFRGIPRWIDSSCQWRPARRLLEVIMRRVIAWVVCAASCLGASAATAQSVPSTLPLVGHWKLNIARSRGATVRLLVTVTRDGEINMTEMGLSARFRLDGKQYPTLGQMASWKEVGPRAWDATVNDGGKMVSVDHYVLSTDEHTLTVTNEIPGRPDGAAETLVVTRVSGGPGLAGAWQGRRHVGDATAEYAVEDGQLRIHLSPSDETFLGRLDGKEYPWSMPGAEPGRLTAVGRLVNARTISIVLKDKGVPFHYATLTVLADGRTLQIDQVHGATPHSAEHSVLVYERR